MLLKGFKFGMLLQIAIGPVCIFIFSLGINHGFLNVLAGVLGVVLADCFYITLAILGISSFIKKENVQNKFNMLGSLIVISFGLELLLNYFDLSFLPKFNIFGNAKTDFPFLKAFFLTASNPMTILFWIGVFSVELDNFKENIKGTIMFSTGALSATLIFLSIIGFLGTLTVNFIDAKTLTLLNAVVGLALIYFGLKKLKNNHKSP